MILDEAVTSDVGGDWGSLRGLASWVSSRASELWENKASFLTGESSCLLVTRNLLERSQGVLVNFSASYSAELKTAICGCCV